MTTDISGLIALVEKGTALGVAPAAAAIKKEFTNDVESAVAVGIIRVAADFLTNLADALVAPVVVDTPAVSSDK